MSIFTFELNNLSSSNEAGAGLGQLTLATVSHAQPELV